MTKCNKCKHDKINIETYNSLTSGIYKGVDKVWRCQKCGYGEASRKPPYERVAEIDVQIQRLLIEKTRLLNS